MINFKKFLLVFIFFFLFNVEVFAGVCSGKSTNSVGYCEIDKTYLYRNKVNTESWKQRYFGTGKTSSGTDKGLLGYAYEVEAGENNTFSSKMEYAFCLDPGEADPTSYKYGRELDINKSEFDANVYKVYQHYIKNFAAIQNNAKDKKYKNQQQLLAYTDVALRSFIYNSNFELSDLKTDSPYYYYSILSYITGNYKSNPNTGNCSKTDKNLDKFSSCGAAWANSKDLLDESKLYYNDVINSSYLWKNPFNIEPTVEKLETGEYKFSFNVSFKDDKYEYFGVTNNGKHFDYTAGYGNAYFQFNSFIINDNTDYDSYISNQSHENQHKIVASNSNNNANVVFSLIVSEDDYNTIQSSDGKVNVGMKYQTYHPMSEENIFINYLNARNVGDSTEGQRMIVFTKFEEEKTIYSGKVDSKKLCQQDGNTFYYNGVIIGFEKYKDKCTCSNIDSNVLDDEKKELYNNLCSVNIIKDEYTSTLDRCEVDNGSNTVTHEVVSRLNQYAVLECKENIEISNFIGSDLSVYSGKHFGLGKYPELTANKNCALNVEYTNWNTDYETKLNAVVSAYNEYIRDYSIDHAFCVPVSGCCGEDCIPFLGAKCRYEYNQYGTNYQEIFKTNIFPIVGSYNTTDCIPDPVTDTSGKKAVLNTKVDGLEKHFQILKDTNNYLNQYPSRYDFYDFENELSFYYEQEYSRSNVGVRLNNNRSDLGNEDDSLFKSNLDSDNEIGEYSSSKYIGSEDKYPYISLDGVEPYISGLSAKYLIGEQLKGRGDYSIDRKVEYKYSYTPSVLKYVDSFSGKISTNPNSLKNSVELGYYYDTDYSAVEKINTNYYEFSKLGEKNYIYDHFSVKNSFSYNGGNYSKNQMQRYCTYETVNELFKTCVGDECNNNDDKSLGDKGDTKLNVVYRIVDPKNIDPNGRLNKDLINEDGTSNGFKNWRNENGLEVKKEIEEADTFNPINIEYSFELDSKSIKEIREYNKSDKNYGDFELDCDASGNKCISDFVSTYAIKDKNGKISGRNDWKD